MESLPKAEILVRNDFYGRESRGSEMPLNRPKAKSGWDVKSRSGKRKTRVVEWEVSVAIW